MAQHLPPDNAKDSGNGVGGAIGGAGIGTLLILLANNLPEDKWFKSWLVIIAPSVAVVINALYNLVKRQIDRYVEEYKTKAAMKRAKTTLQAAIDSDLTPEPDKDKYKADLVELEKLLIESDVSLAKAYLARRGKVD